LLYALHTFLKDKTNGLSLSAVPLFLWDPKDQLFRIAGSLIDIPRSAVHTVFIIAIGHLHSRDISYLNDIRNLELPVIKLLLLEYHFHQMEQTYLKEKIVKPILESIEIKVKK
jgi:hypothetical protein